MATGDPGELEARESRTWARRLREHPAPIVVAVGLLLFLPHVDLGFLFDDHYHLAILERLDPEALASPMELWSWHRDGRTPLFAGRVQGDVLPWWAADDLSIDFFRPLPSLLHALDHALWERRAAPRRVTSFAVWALLLLAVVALYRELGRHAGTGPGLVLLAGLYFALDDCHTWNVLWLATRHSLLAVLFSTVTVAAYLRFRRRKERRALYVALLSLVAGLLSSEVTVGVLAWVAAYELLLPRQPWGERLRAAAPVAAVVSVYVLGYRLAGFGAHGSRWYLDPFDAPASFLAEALPLRLPRLLQGLLTPVPAEVGLLFPTAAGSIVGLVFLAVMIGAMLPLLRRDATFRFVALATLLSGLPTAIVVPINYLLLWPSVGAAWLLARLTAWAWGIVRARERPHASWRRAVAAALIVLTFGVHGLYAPALGQLLVGQLRGAVELPGWLAERTDYPGAEEAAGARVLFVTFPWSVASSYMPVAWRVLRAPPWPDALWVVSTGYGDFRFERTGEASFRLEAPDSGTLGSYWEGIVHDGSDLVPGRRFRRGAMLVTVEELDDDDGLRRFEVEIDRPLDHPDVWLLSWNGERLARFRPPAIGEAITLAAERASP